MNPEAIWAWLRDLDWGMWAALGLMLWIAYCVVVGAVAGIVGIVGRFRGLPPRQRA
jgi:hypothetical protein